MKISSPTVLAVLLAFSLMASFGHTSPGRLIGVGGPTLGGSGAGGVNPTPPIGNAPVDPSLAIVPSGGTILLMVQGSERRVVVLRSRSGDLLALRLLEPGQLATVWAPARGALLDVLGTDVVGLPVAPGLHLLVEPGS